ncbi:putative nucleic-acid-binding Zn-ribbon protein [Salibacterium salarium]|uniref:zinc ribbon domain-containing protein n=1 Tax=Salibacterium salarium TaxID=284579 RepID=UPI002783DD0F|nr:zinc ribbon domain-containing protein [Salibacterium salarium]MDQ0300818.1 putative nucleic-acid-binding Zn-ribbon protein [Salibacterium salarium]
MEEQGCFKCGHKDAGTKEIAASGTGFSKFFDVQNNHFTVVYCKNCGYSELYNTKVSGTSNLLDFFLGG